MRIQQQILDNLNWSSAPVMTSTDRQRLIASADLSGFRMVSDSCYAADCKSFNLSAQGFHRTYATGAACQQRTLTPPDTWSCPTLGLACVLMSRPISPELVLSPNFWISNIPRYFSFAWKLYHSSQLAERSVQCWEKKEEIWLSPITKAPTPTEQFKKLKWQHKYATKNFDYTTIADRLRTVS